MSELLYKDLSYRVVGCCLKVQNTLGSGHKESVYQKSLAIELAKDNIKFESGVKRIIWTKQISVISKN